MLQITNVKTVAMYTSIKMRPLLIYSMMISVLCSTLFAQNKDTNTFSFENRKNSVYLAHDFYLTISANYERIFEINDKNNLGFRVGLGSNGGEKSYTVIGEALYIYGMKKHFLEIGIGYNQPYYYKDSGPDNPDIALMAGWRYQAKKGFLLKIYPEFFPNFFDVEDEASLGYVPFFIGFALGKTF